MDLGIQNKIAIVTGAGGGIGREVAKGLSLMGAKVVVCDINENSAKDTLAEMSGDHVLNVKDLSKVSECELLIRETVENYGTIHILVNLAAILQRTPIEEVNEESWNQIISVNLKSQFFLLKETIKVMSLQKWGRIINFSSQGGFTGGYATSCVYSMSKGGVLTMTRSFARTYAASGICVNAIMPGGIDTEMMKLSPKDLEDFTNMIPMKRLGKSDEMVGVVLFLASNWASYITGATIDVTGGQLMR